LILQRPVCNRWSVDCGRHPHSSWTIIHKISSALVVHE